MTDIHPDLRARFSLEGRVAIVTGALGLLGKRHCVGLAQAGAHVVVVDLDGRACGRFAEVLEAEGHPRGLGVGVDVTEKGSVEALREAVLRSFGRIDVLVNNAAINDKFEDPISAAELSKFEHYPLELWRRSLDANVTGTFLCCQVLGAEMSKARRGSIVNIASTYGIVAPDQSIYRDPEGVQSFHKSASYPTTKAAVLGLTRFLATYWGREGVRVNALSPGGVQNGQASWFVENYSTRTPLGRMSREDELVGAIVFLASDASSYVTGANVVVDGGWTAW